MSLSSSHLPLSLNPFVGRAAELEQLEQMLKIGARLITIAGPGGAGKTRLAAEFARRRSDAGDPVLFVDLTRHDSASAAVLELLNPGSKATVDAAVKEISSRASSGLLVVLDNLEHLVDEAAQLVPAMLALNEVRVVGTSREPLRLGGEQVVRVGPLSPDEALELFNMRARSVIPEFDAGDQSRDAIREIIARVDCLPLGIELAASRVNVLSPKGLAERLTSRMSALKSKDRDRPERHRTVAATAQWSWELLSDTERAVLRELSVFRGEFSLNAAEAVVDVEGVDVVDIVDDLVERSMLERKGDRVFRLFQTIYGMAAQELDGCELAPSVFERHAAYFANEVFSTPRHHRASCRTALFELKLAVERTTGEPRGRAMAAVSTILSELGGMDSAVDVALQVVDEIADHEVRSELELAIGQALLDRMELEDARKWAKRAHETASSEGLLEIDAQAMTIGAISLMWRHRYEEALEELHEALKIARRSGSVNAEIKVQGNVALALSNLGQNAASQDHIASALNRGRASGDEFIVARLLVNVGVWHAERHDWAEAEPALVEALEMLENVEDRRLEAHALVTLARVKLALGHVEEARSLYVRADHTARDYGQVSVRLESLVGLGSLRESSSDRVYLVKAVDLAQNTGSVDDEMLARSMLMLFDMRFGSFPLARHQARRLLDSVAVPESWKIVIRALSALTAGWSGDAEDIPEPPEEDIWIEALISTVSAIVEASSAPARQASGSVIEARKNLGRLQEVFPAPELRAWPAQHVTRVLENLLDERFSDVDVRALRLHPEGRFFQPPNAEVIDFSRRGALRGVLVGLAKARDESPGKAVTLDDVLELGWPGEIITAEAGASRVYSAIRTLRNNGLEDVLQTNDAGYFVASDVAVVWDETLGD